MSSIQRISRLRHPGVLRDFTWPADLPDFGRFNLIYGWNGSGKTTISRVFRAIEQRTALAEGEATVRVDGHEVTEHAFQEARIPVRVFNRDFVNESVFPATHADVPAIFVVGKENVAKQKVADTLKADRTQRELERQKALAARQHAEKEIERHCADRARVIKDTLRGPGHGTYNEYDKRAYRTRAHEMMKTGDATSHRLDDAERDKLLSRHGARIKPTVSLVSYRMPSLKQMHDAVDATLRATVTSEVIGALKDDSELSEWVRHGLELHKGRAAATCLFCEQPMPRGRMEALESHFSVEYARFLQRLNQQADDLRLLVQRASDLALPDRATLFEDLAAEYDSCRADVTEALRTVSAFAGSLLKAVEEKRSQPFTSTRLPANVPTLGEDVVGRLNEVIGRHNLVCGDFEAQTSDARDRLALDLIAQGIDDFSRLTAAASEASDVAARLERDVGQLSAEIERLEREIVEHRQPAEELNEDLRKYLGHDELSLQVKETGYQLVRHGKLADSLSEGECTALALLYFLKSLSDRRFDLKHGVVVLDDPVSSLDANALYLAFGYVQHHTKNAGQLLLLTHNFAFFRQARNWFYHLKGQNKKDIAQRPARFYMLAQIQGSHPRSTTLRALDPLLEQYESEYHYLFACVYRAANATGETTLEQNYGLANVARRLLEMFLAFRRPKTAGELSRQMEAVPFDEARKTRILRFLHTHSHGGTVGGPEHDASLLGEAPAVLADLLELIKFEDSGHFAAMVDLVTSPEGEADTE